MEQIKLTDEINVHENKPVRSWSQFSLYMRCPELYRAKYIDRELPRIGNLNMHLGSAVHLAHEKMAEARLLGSVDELTLEEAKQVASDYWENGLDELPPESATTLALTKKTMLQCVSSYHSFWSKSEAVPLHIEENLLWYPEGYPFGVRMIIDRIDKGGKLVDLKTSGKSPPKSRATGKHYIQSGYGYDMQLDLYMLGMRHVLNIEPTSAGLEVVVKNKNTKVIYVSHELREDRLNSMLDLMANLEESIQAGNFPKNRMGTFCSPRMCDNWEACTGILVEPDIFSV
jgi:RecB family exonuclease